MSRLLQTRTQTLNLDKKYDTYLASNGELETVHSNPLNLFDDSNTEDRAWFKLVKIYMTQKGRRNI